MTQSSVVDPLTRSVESSAYQEDTVSPTGSPFVAIPEPGVPSPLTEQVDHAHPRPDAGETGDSPGAVSASASAAAANDLLLRAPAEETGPDALSRRLGRQGHDASSATRAVESLGTGSPNGQTQTAPVPPDGALVIVPAGSGTPVIVTHQGR